MGVKEYLRRVLDEEISEDASLHELLKDGTLLCKIVNKKYPNMIRGVKKSSSLMYKWKISLNLLKPWRSSEYQRANYSLLLTCLRKKICKLLLSVWIIFPEDGLLLNRLLLLLQKLLNKD